MKKTFSKRPNKQLQFVEKDASSTNFIENQRNSISINKVNGIYNNNGKSLNCERNACESNVLEQIVNPQNNFIMKRKVSTPDFSRKKRCLKKGEAIVLDMGVSNEINEINYEVDKTLEPVIKKVVKNRDSPKINIATKKYLMSIYSNPKSEKGTVSDSPISFSCNGEDTENIVPKLKNTDEGQGNASTSDIFKCPNPLKPKQLRNVNGHACKENLLTDDFDMSQLFKSTQIEKIITSELNNRKPSNTLLNNNEAEMFSTQIGDLSQIFKSSQIDRILSNPNLLNTKNESDPCNPGNKNREICAKQKIEEIQIPENTCYGNDGFVKAPDLFGSSQIFKSSDLENLMTNVENSTLNINNDNKFSGDLNNGVIQKNTFDLQKLMREENENNVSLNDDLENNDLLNAAQSSQYKKEIEALFDICEISICNISPDANPNENEANETMGLAAIQGINWENDSMMLNEVNAQSKSQSRMSIYDTIKQTLLNNAQKNTALTQAVPSVNKYPIRDKPDFVSRGPFYNLPVKCQQLISQYKNITKLYDWQDECLKLPAINQRKNLIYALPTSGGKTLVAEILILREILCRKKNVIFILPYVSIVQEKIWALSPFAVALDFLVEEYAGGKGQCPPRKRRCKNSVYIATIEKSLGLLNSLCEMGRMQEVGLIVVDELHLLGEAGRGATLEIVLTKVMDSKEDIQIIGMSATIGNISEVATFLEAEVYTRDFRPVELKEYVKCGPDIMTIATRKNSSEDFFKFSRTCEYHYTDIQAKWDPDHIAGLVLEILPDSSCLVFCPSKKNCENVALLICRMFPDSLLEHRKEEKQGLYEMIKRDCGSVCPTLHNTLPYGVAYHHSGLTSDERKHLEDAYRAGVISVICCTSTLAAGVNLPAKRVILRSPYVGKDFITLSKYKQMIGRAGRAGFGETGESILIFSAKDTERIQNLLCSPMDEAISSLHFFNSEGLKSLILSSVGLNTATTRIELRSLVNKTLMAVQAHRLEVNVKQLTDQTISGLFKLGALVTKEESKKVMPTLIDNSIMLSQTQKAHQEGENDTNAKKCVLVGRNTHLAISKLGRAAARACINLRRAHLLYNDLLQAQSGLVLVDCLHLLYLVTPYEQCEQIKPNMAVYYSVYTKLGPKELETAKVLGINEACAIKMLSGKQVKNVPTRILNRFYITLMLYDLWNHETVHDVSNKYHVPRGSVQSLMTSAASFSSSVYKFCEELEEFWAFKDLLVNFTQRLQHCCTLELLPLMELPSVQIARAKQLYNAGYKTLHLIAKATPSCLARDIENLNKKVASQLISNAKLLLLEKVENLREEAEEVLEGLWST